MNHNWVDYLRLLETLFATEREQELKYQGYFINNNFVQKLKSILSDSTGKGSSSFLS